LLSFNANEKYDSARGFDTSLERGPAESKLSQFERAMREKEPADVPLPKETKPEPAPVPAEEHANDEPPAATPAAEQRPAPTECPFSNRPSVVREDVSFTPFNDKCHSATLSGSITVVEIRAVFV